MTTRTFMLPMQAPANGTGKGTHVDPWRPKYMREMGLKHESRVTPDRRFAVSDVTGEDKQLDELAAMPDVQELKSTDIQDQKGLVLASQVARRGH